MRNQKTDTFEEKSERTSYEVPHLNRWSIH